MAARASLGGIPFRTNPHQISWDFKVKVVERRTLGGNVIQVLGTSLGDLTVMGSFGRGGWQEQRKFFSQIHKWATRAGDQEKATPLKFSYPPRGWNFDVFIKDFSGPGGEAVRLHNEEIDPQWRLTLFVVNESARKIADGITNKHIARLMEGVGWKQSAYNGPLEPLDQVLAGAGASSVQEFFEMKAEEVYVQSIEGTYTSPFFDSDVEGVF